MITMNDIGNKYKVTKRKVSTYLINTDKEGNISKYEV